MVATFVRVAAFAMGALAFACAALDPVIEWNALRPAPVNIVIGGLREHVVLRCAPGSNCAAAGLRAGDRVDFVRPSVADGYRLWRGWTGDRQIALQVGEGTSRVAVLKAAGPLGNRLTPESAMTVSVFNAAFMSISALIAAVICVRRPSLMTIALAFYCVFGPMSRPETTYALSWLPDGILGTLLPTINGLLGGAPIFALLPFVARFPSRRLSEDGEQRWHVADIVFVIATLFFIASSFTVWPRRTTLVASVADASAGMAIIAWCAVRFARSTGETRRRVGWVLSGLAVSAAGYAGQELTITLSAQSWLVVILDSVVLAFPLAVAYAILRHRVIDVGFAWNRSLGFGIVTVVLVVTVSTVHWLVGRLIHEEQFAVAVDAIVSVLFGIALTWVHHRIERLVDRLFFRKRYRAETQIQVRVAALESASDSETVDATLTEDVAQIFRLASTAVFRREGDVFVRTASVGWSSANARKIEVSDLIIRSLLAGERLLDLDAFALYGRDFPAGRFAPNIAVPIVARHQLIGVAFYGRRDDTELDPKERSFLERLAHAAADAQASIEAERWKQIALGSGVVRLPR